MASCTQIIPDRLLGVIKGGAETISERLKETAAYFYSLMQQSHRCCFMSLKILWSYKNRVKKTDWWDTFAVFCAAVHPPRSSRANCAVFPVKAVWRFGALNQREAEGVLVGNLENKVDSVLRQQGVLSLLHKPFSSPASL